MITDLIINAFLFLPLLLLTGLETLDFNFSFPEGVYDTLYNISKGVAFVLPLKFLLSIFAIKLSIHAFRLVWSIVIRVKSFIPTMGA